MTWGNIYIEIQLPIWICCLSIRVNKKQSLNVSLGLLQLLYFCLAVRCLMNVILLFFFKLTWLDLLKYKSKKCTQNVDIVWELTFTFCLHISAYPPTHLSALGVKIFSLSFLGLSCLANIVSLLASLLLILYSSRQGYVMQKWICLQVSGEEKQQNIFKMWYSGIQAVRTWRVSHM